MKTTKAKTNKASKAKSNKEHDKLPGEYPPSEDIMNEKNGTTRVDADFEDLEEGKINDRVASNEQPVKNNLTKDDLMALGDVELSNDEGDDEQLKNRVTPVDFSGADLDVPGSELDDESEERGSEDEENNSYSLDKQD